MWRGGAGGGSWIADVWVDVCEEGEWAGDPGLLTYGWMCVERGSGRGILDC